MGMYFITFRSVTLAQRGEQVLRRGGIRCRLQRTPRWMEEQGCGYSLGLRPQDGGDALELLRREKVIYRKIYAQQNDGRVEEVRL